ncbi:hypothetical protein VTJ04DRAFT_3817 [Mycothermus thermophilus]|uniref:uncharacterized protein n=1 Tax=Humicola insolens TaxID=85995 RepID=UPI00374267B5
MGPPPWPSLDVALTPVIHLTALRSPDFLPPLPTRSDQVYPQGKPQARSQARIHPIHLVPSGFCFQVLSIYVFVVAACSLAVGHRTAFDSHSDIRLSMPCSPHIPRRASSAVQTFTTAWPRTLLCIQPQ